MSALFKTSVFVGSLLISGFACAYNTIGFSVQNNLQSPMIAEVSGSYVGDPFWLTNLPSTVAGGEHKTGVFDSWFSPGGSFSFSVSYQLSEGGTSINNGSFKVTMNSNVCTVTPKYISSTQNDYTITAYYNPNSDPPYDNCEISVTSEALPLPEIDVNVSNQSVHGSLTNGYINISSGTCAVNSSNCDNAAAIQLNHDETSPLFTFTGSTSSYTLGANLIYKITDPNLPTQHNVMVTLQNGEEILDRCKATIEPAMNGSIKYNAQATQVGSGNDAYCNVEVTRSITPVPGSPSIDVVINNQMGRSPGSAAYTYALKDGVSDVLPGYGQFDPVNLVDVPVNKSEDITSLTALEGPESFYQGSLNYVLDDYVTQGVPTASLLIALNNTNPDPNTWCEAGISGLNQGYRIYNVSTQLSQNNTVCTVNITSTDNSQEPGQYGFVVVDTLPTQGIEKWEYFSISNVSYLAAANAEGTTTSYPSATMFYYDDTPGVMQFRPTKNNFLVVGAVCAGGKLKDHPAMWRHFYAGEKHRIIMANQYAHNVNGANECQDSVNYYTSSPIYQWDSSNGGGFSYNGVETLLADSPTAWEFYTVNGQSYLTSIGNYQARKSYASVYKWQETKFVLDNNQPELKSLSSASDIQTFTVNGLTYLIISQSDKDDDTFMYYVADNGYLSLNQGGASGFPIQIAETGRVKKALVFQDLAGDYFLILGYTPEAINDPAVEAWIYKLEYYDDTQYHRWVFKPHIKLDDSFKNVQSWEHVSDGRYDFLAAATGDTFVNAYLWNSQTKLLDANNAYSVWNSDKGINAYSLTGFTIDGSVFFALATYGVDPERERIESPIVQWQRIGD